MTEIVTIDWFGRWGRDVFSVNIAIFAHWDGWEIENHLELYCTWLTFEQILSNFSGVMTLCKFGHFNLVCKISRKVFELGVWNLVS